jgi:type I restriction enzyme S subunit
MEKFAVVVPFLPEQLRIAEILSTWDRAIETVEALIANARAQKAALMQQLLTGKRRLPGFSGEWLDLKLGDAAMVDRDSLGQNTPKTFSFRYISLSDVQSGRIAEKLPNLAFAEAPSRARRKVRVGDILMATVRPNLQAFARVGSEHADCIASTGFAVLSHRAGFDPSFMFHSLFSQRFTDQIEALVVGSNYPAINSTDIKSLTLLFPDFEEQKAVGELLDVADAEVRMLESELTALRQEKAALMQQLLTGKRRVKLDTASAP